MVKKHLKHNLKRAILILFAFMLVALFIIYRTDLIPTYIKNVTGDNKKEVALHPETQYIDTQTISTGSAVVSEAAVNTENAEVTNVDDIIITYDKIKNDYILGEKVGVDTMIVKADTKLFGYQGVSLTPYANYKKMLFNSWGVQNKNKFPVNVNVSLKFYDKNKKCIGVYQRDVDLKLAEYDATDEELLNDCLKLGKEEVGSVNIEIPSDCLEGAYDFSDVYYYSIHNVK